MSPLPPPSENYCKTFAAATVDLAERGLVKRRNIVRNGCQLRRPLRLARTSSRPILDRIRRLRKISDQTQW
ncbi:BQ5605_C007g04729 [Microbotryum silenes-dioicae]|uniref:BQ5605_C007g04729 protein n=1 Tax=Microbotryum silenes-dioicae TaxID=796604 RepID=A0A2X0MUZ2_9BASI|nr:BQ5605_C007g04729 [Microbotryum silenes-dioicae]